MKNQFPKKIIASVVSFIFIFSVVLLPSHKAHAQYPVTDAVDIIQNTLGEMEGAVTAAATTNEEIETTVLNKIATAIAKQLLMQVTQSVITWINSGFHGNPAFIQNPTAFFENVGDQATGAFISQSGALSSLCSPFSLQVRLAIAQRQLQLDGVNGSTSNQYACTLSTIINNSTNAVNNASIQGFIGGDFSQGGLAAFSVMVTQPQNTPNGAYLQAEMDLDHQIDVQVQQKQTQLSQGQGFLSWETCTPNNTSSGGSASSDEGDIENPDQSSVTQTVGNGSVSAADVDSEGGVSVTSDPSAADDEGDIENPDQSSVTQTVGNGSVSAADVDSEGGVTVNSDPSTDNAQSTSSVSAADVDSEGGGSVTSDPSTDNTGSNSSANQDEVDTEGGAGSDQDPYGSAAENSPSQTCSVQTPGSVISAALNKHLGVPTEELELANSINDIINAAFSELVVMALQKGLTSVTQTNSSGSSYLQASINSANQQSFAATQQQLITTITPYITNAQQIEENYNQALTLAITANATLGEAESCYEGLQNSATTTSSYSFAEPYIQGQLTYLQNIANASATPLLTDLSEKEVEASSTVAQYEQIYTQATTAKTLADLPSDTLSTISSSVGFQTQASVQSAQINLAPEQAEAQQINQEAATSLQQCRSFNPANAALNQ